MTSTVPPGRGPLHRDPGTSSAHYSLLPYSRTPLLECSIQLLQLLPVQSSCPLANNLDWMALS